MTPEPQQEEPTVLDLFKSATRNWDSFITFLGSLNDSERLAEVEQAAVVEAHQQAVAVPAESAVSIRAIPWRMVGALLLALFGQLQLEPPSPRTPLALGLYALAIGLALWSYFSNEWTLPALEPDLPRQDPMSLRFIPLILSAVLSVAAFIDLSNDLFTWHNVLLWLAAIGAFLWAMWIRVPRPRSAPLTP